MNCYIEKLIQKLRSFVLIPAVIRVLLLAILLFTIFDQVWNTNEKHAQLSMKFFIFSDIYFIVLNVQRLVFSARMNRVLMKHFINTLCREHC